MDALSQNTKITASDINKLIEECNNKVSLTADATISGIKTFSNTVHLKCGSTLVDGTVSKQITGTMANNDNWWIGVGGNKNDDGFVEFATNDNGIEPIYVRQYNGASTLVNSLTLLDASGNTIIPKNLTVNGDGGNVVKTTGEQNISGTKRFNGLVLKNGNLTVGTLPSSTNYCAIHWTDSTNGTGASNRMATVEYGVDANGKSWMTLGPYQWVSGKTSYTGNLMNLSVYKDGTTSTSINNLTVNGSLNIPGGKIWIA
jgi:hypothetical protein